MFSFKLLLFKGTNTSCATRTPACLHLYFSLRSRVDVSVHSPKCCCNYFWVWSSFALFCHHTQMTYTLSIASLTYRESNCIMARGPFSMIWLLKWKWQSQWLLVAKGAFNIFSVAVISPVWFELAQCRRTKHPHSCTSLSRSPALLPR